MSNATSFGVAVVEAAKTPTIYNISTPGTASTEFSQVLTAGTKRFELRVRGTATLQFAFVATESATKFITVKKNNFYTSPSVNLTGKTLYMQVDKATQVVELLEWS